MAFRPELKPYQVLTSADMSGSRTSLVTIIQKLSLISYTFSWSGSSPVGTLSAQISNDYSIDSQGNVSNAGNWSAVTFASGSGTGTTIAVSGNTGTANINLPLVGAYAIRTIFTFTSGTGTLQAYICGKVS